MPIYEIAANEIRRIEPTTFGAAGVRERADLQRLLRRQIDIIAPDTLVIAEEFGEWEDSRRRIDLLGLDKDANLVVIELKRTEDGGHMELQAVRYAAMVAAMTFDKVVEVYAAHLANMGQQTDARTAILEFLGWDEPDEDQFAQDVRIVLVSAEFSREVTTTVMWLNERDLDIRCIRMRPYADNGRVLVDVQQVVPLPEAQDYMVRLREKEGKERTARREQSDSQKLLVRFWTELLQKAKTKTDLHARVSPSKVWWIGTNSGRSGVTLRYVFGRKWPRVELYIDTDEAAANKRLYDQLYRDKAAIEERFGGPLGWERLDDNRASRVKVEFEAGTVFDESNWPELQEKMISTMIRFEKAIRPALDRLE